MIKNIFSEEVTNEIVDRINKLTPTQQRNWGKMSVDQMLAHCNKPYAYTYEPEKFQKPKGLMKFMLKNFIKKFVVSETPYKPNGRTSPDFITTGTHDFEQEKNLLIANIQKAQTLGRSHFEGKENLSFGVMTAQEWNNMYYKHIDHHLRQFGV